MQERFNLFADTYNHSYNFFKKSEKLINLDCEEVAIYG